MSTPPGSTTRKPLPAQDKVIIGAYYHVLAQLATLSALPDLIAARISVLVILVLLPALRQGRWLAWATLAAAACGLYVALAAGRAVSLLLLPPVLLNGFMAWVFGRTLRDGRMPLIEIAARAMRGPGAQLDDDVVAYARGVTQAWTGLFVVLAVVNLVLAMLARPAGLLVVAGFDPAVSVPLSAWSLFANLLSYLLIAALFAIEFVVRARRFPHQPYSGVIDFTRRLAAQGHLFRPAAVGHDPENGRKPQN